MVYVDGVQMWDAGTGQGFSQYTEHQKRAWSVDFSLADPMMFASGSDDCSVRLWSINEVCFLLYCAHSICGPKLYCSCLALSSIISTNAKLQQLTKSTF